MTTADDLHPLLRSRFSPIRFDRRAGITPAEVDLLVEAARWAPSAGNSQPWAFVAARRGTPEHEALVACLAASARRWAPDAAVLVVNLVHATVEGADWAYSDFAVYDLGQAVAHMTFQAQAMGLACRQFRAFDLGRLSTVLEPDDGWAPLTMTAVGRAAGGDRPARERRALSDLRSIGGWGLLRSRAGDGDG